MLAGETVIDCVVAPPGLQLQLVAVPPFSVKVTLLPLPLHIAVADALIPAAAVVTVNAAPALVAELPPQELVLTTTS